MSETPIVQSTSRVTPSRLAGCEAARWIAPEWSPAQRRRFLAGHLCASCMGEATADRWGGFVVRHRMPCARIVVVRNGRVEVGPLRTPEESTPEPNSRAREARL